MHQTVRKRWQDELANVVTDLEALAQHLQLDADTLRGAYPALQQFALRVPRGFIARMQPGDMQDPLLRQVLPLAQEMEISPGYSHDPLGEKVVNQVPGLLHKYHGRVLLLVNGACAINCRYCFRRHFPYVENSKASHNWCEALDYIAADSTISEIILSGGDPLMLKDHKLADLMQRLEKIKHIKRLRIHTRLPIVIPTRINDDLLAWVQQLKLPLVWVLHCNHPREIDVSVAHAMARLGQQKNVTLLNQTVLLRGVNDDISVLTDLSETLFAQGILPYYLHLLDTVSGAAHFQVDLSRAKQLYAQLLTRLPGYLVPKLVYEKAGMLTKVPVCLPLDQLVSR